MANHGFSFWNGFSSLFIYYDCYSRAWALVREFFAVFLEQLKLFENFPAFFSNNSCYLRIRDYFSQTTNVIREFKQSSPPSPFSPAMQTITRPSWVGKLLVWIKLIKPPKPIGSVKIPKILRKGFIINLTFHKLG